MKYCIKQIFTNRYYSCESNIVLPWKNRLPTGNTRHLASLSLPRATAPCPVSRTRKPSSYSRFFQWWMLSLSGKFSEPSGNPRADTESSESELEPDALENKWFSFCYRNMRRPKCFICQHRNSHSSKSMNIMLSCYKIRLFQGNPALSNSAMCQLTVLSTRVWDRKCIFYSRWTAMTAFRLEYGISFASNSNLSRSSLQYLPTSSKTPYKGQLNIIHLLQCIFSINQGKVY